MQLHGNAALSVKKRLLLCRRVVEQGCSVRRARKWVRRHAETHDHASKGDTHACVRFVKDSQARRG